MKRKKKTIWFRIKRRINETIGAYCRKVAGVEELENNLYYILNHTVDITACKPATGLLRQLQLADTELLKLFHLFCEKNHLQYWLDYGTLLGG